MRRRGGPRKRAQISMERQSSSQGEVDLGEAARDHAEGLQGGGRGAPVVGATAGGTCAPLQSGGSTVPSLGMRSGCLPGASPEANARFGARLRAGQPVAGSLVGTSSAGPPGAGGALHPLVGMVSRTGPLGARTTFPNMPGQGLGLAGVVASPFAGFPGAGLPAAGATMAPAEDGGVFARA